MAVISDTEHEYIKQAVACIRTHSWKAMREIDPRLGEDDRKHFAHIKKNGVAGLRNVYLVPKSCPKGFLCVRLEFSALGNVHKAVYVEVMFPAANKSLRGHQVVPRHPIYFQRSWYAGLGNPGRRGESKLFGSHDYQLIS